MKWIENRRFNFKFYQSVSLPISRNMKLLIIMFLLFPCFSFVCFAETKTEKVDISDPVILEGSAKGFKNSCFTGIRRPVKLYDQFLEASLKHTKIVKILRKLERQSNDFYAASDKLYRAYNDLNKKLNGVDSDVVAERLNQKFQNKPNWLENWQNKIKRNRRQIELVHEKNDLFVDMESSFHGRYRKLLRKSDVINEKMVRLENMFYLSLKANNMSEYAVTGLLDGMKKKIKIHSAMIIMRRNHQPVRKKIINVLKEMVSLKRKRLALFETGQSDPDRRPAFAEPKE